MLFFALLTMYNLLVTVFWSLNGTDHAYLYSREDLRIDIHGKARLWALDLGQYIADNYQPSV